MDDKKIIGYIEKQEEPEPQKEEQPKEKEKMTQGYPDDTTTTEEEGLAAGPCRRKTQSIMALKKAANAAKIKEQKRRYLEATKWRRATDAALGDMDLKEAMEQAEPEKTTTTMSMVTSTVVTASTSSTTCEVVAEVYAKPYTKTAESRGECSSARSERRENLEKQLNEQQQKEEEERLAKIQEAAEQHWVVERALLEEEEK